MKSIRYFPQLIFNAFSMRVTTSCSMSLQNCISWNHNFLRPWSLSHKCLKLSTISTNFLLQIILLFKVFEAVDLLDLTKTFTTSEFCGKTKKSLELWNFTMKSWFLKTLIFVSQMSEIVNNFDEFFVANNLTFLSIPLKFE